MISLKFLDGVLHQSIQKQPGGQWTDYHPVPSEKTIKPQSLEEKFDMAFMKNNIYRSKAILKELVEVAEQHFAKKS